MDFKDQVAIVTGSSSGIGEAAAVGFAKGGGRVVVNFSKNEEGAQNVVEKCKLAGSDAIAVKADVSIDSHCEHIVNQAKSKWGRIDILVNNAGRTKFVKHSDLGGLTKDDFENIYALNTIAPFQMIRAARDSLGKSENGAVVNMSSIAGLRAYGSSVAYAASKAALNSLTLSLARALGPESIRVNSVCPGFVGTDWFYKTQGKETFERLVEKQKEETPLRRAGRADDITGAVLFFSSAWSKHITGQMLAVDAGMTLGKL